VSAALFLALALGTLGPGGAPIMHATFARPDGLVTNEYAEAHPQAAGAVASRLWLVTSGSMYARNGVGWTGVPDGESPDARSTNGTGSAVLRLVSRRRDLADVRVSLRLRVDRLIRTERTPAVDWDGVHVFLRYQSPQHLYYASVGRRDGKIVVKKKCPGGTSNGGTYVTLAEEPRFGIPRAAWRTVAVSIVTRADGSVRIGLERRGREVLVALDRGQLCAPITSPGRVGLRGDNAEFQFDDFVVRPAAS
jgi:hypothetical protein